MSSSEPGALARVEFFQPDVPTVGQSHFVPEAAATRTPPAEDESVKDMEEFRAGPTEEELRALFRREMEETLQSELARIRGEDAQAFQELGRSIHDANRERLDTIAKRAVELSVALAERLVRDRIDRDPEVIQRVLREALEGIDAGSAVTVHAHPDDASYLRSHPDVLSELGVSEVIDDPRQRRGGCLIDAGSAGWDVTVITQLSTLQDAIDRVLEAS